MLHGNVMRGIFVNFPPYENTRINFFFKNPNDWSRFVSPNCFSTTSESTSQQRIHNICISAALVSNLVPNRRWLGCVTVARVATAAMKARHTRGQQTAVPGRERRLRAMDSLQRWELSWPAESCATAVMLQDRLNNAAVWAEGMQETRWKAEVVEMTKKELVN